MKLKPRHQRCGMKKPNQLVLLKHNQGMLNHTNRPDMKLGTNDRLVQSIRGAPQNQAYRPLLLSKSTGLATYLDSDVPAGLVRYTDNQGNLTFTADDITGHSTVEVSGYFGSLGASRCFWKTKMLEPRLRRPRKERGLWINQLSWPSLHAQTSKIFVKTPSQYTNRVIAQNAKLFQRVGNHTWICATVRV